MNTQPETDFDLVMLDYDFKLNEKLFNRFLNENCKANPFWCY